MVSYLLKFVSQLFKLLLHLHLRMCTRACAREVRIERDRVGEREKMRRRESERTRERESERAREGESERESERARNRDRKRDV